MKIIIFNIRAGFCSNSSSTHSILFCSDNSGVQDSYDEDGFHWDYFTINSEEGVLRYLAGTLNSSFHYQIHKDYIEAIVPQWTGISLDELPSVDHQSVISLPLTFDEKIINKQFFMELKDLLLSNNTLILGGNDNDDEDHPYENFPNSAAPFFLKERVFIGRKDEEYGFWTFFNRENGYKFRFILNGRGEDEILPEKASTPELVDIKITSFCDSQCKFCYMGSTKEGRPGETSHIRTVIDTLARDQVFEIAYGGGEPTSHPDFINILKYTRESHIIPNFTTKNIQWLHQHLGEVAHIIGSCAVSVTNSSEIKRLATIRDFYDLKSHKLCVQIVMGTLSKSAFQSILKAACDYNIPITLLGFKTNGRGGNFKVIPHDDWLDWTKEIIHESMWYKVGIDTALVQYSKTQLNDAPQWLYHADEGKFSWYIDAVDKQHGKSSYDKLEPYKFVSQYLTTFREA